MSAALLDGTTAAGAVLVLSLVAGLGLALGAVKVRGVGLGIAGVLFVGIAFGHFGVSVEEQTREFVRELGLVFFVYSIGLQVGRWLGPNRFVALDARYSIGLSDAFDVSLAANRSWQFRAYVGFPLGR